MILDGLLIPSSPLTGVPSSPQPGQSSVRREEREARRSGCCPQSARGTPASVILSTLQVPAWGQVLTACRPTCGAPTLWRQSRIHSLGIPDFPPRFYQNRSASSRHGPDGQSTRQRRWSTSLLWTPSVPSSPVAHDTLHLVAAHTAPLSIRSYTSMVYLDRPVGSLFSCSVPSARSSIRPSLQGFASDTLIIFPPRRLVGPNPTLTHTPSCSRIHLRAFGETFFSTSNITPFVLLHPGRSFDRRKYAS